MEFDHNSAKRDGEWHRRLANVLFDVIVGVRKVAHRDETVRRCISNKED